MAPRLPADMQLFVLLKCDAGSVETISDSLWQLPGVLGIEELPADGDALFRPDQAHSFARFDSRQQFDDWLRIEAFPVGLLKVYLDLPDEASLEGWLKQLPPCEVVSHGTIVPQDHVASIRKQFYGYDVGQRFW